MYSESLGPLKLYLFIIIIIIMIIILTVRNLILTCLFFLWKGILFLNIPMCTCQLQAFVFLQPEAPQIRHRGPL